MEWVRDALLVAGAYLLGAVPFAYIVAKAVKGIDIRTVGSGNVGATNVGRVFGRKWGITVFILDMLKGVIPVLAGLWLHGHRPGTGALPPAVALAGLAAIVGHNWPVFLKFKGGKGVATSCGVFLAIFPQGLGIAFAAWLIVVAITRYVSVGSMIAGVVFLLCAILLQAEPFGRGKYLTAFAALAAVLSIIRHRSNIQRLMQGTENKVGGKKG